MLGYSAGYSTGYSAFYFLTYYAFEKACALFCTKFGLITMSQKFYIEGFRIFPIMLALCLMFSGTCYAQNYAGIIGLGLQRTKVFQFIYKLHILN